MQRDTYPTTDQLDNIEATARQLRKGHKLHPARRGQAFTVIVDGEHHQFRTLSSVRSFLTACVIPAAGPRVFRNADKGVTVNVDVPAQA